jgi:hypothetical protein
MERRARILRTLAIVALASALLVPATGARADQAYDRVATAYAQGGGRLDACQFTQAQLEAALAGVPKAIAKFVPDLKNAIRHGIRAHARGACKGIAPGTTTPSGGATAPVPGTTTPTAPTTVAPTSTQGATIPPPATAPATTTPTTTAPTPASAAPSDRHHDRTPLLAGAIALGALLALLLALWLLGRLRGWDPPWLARQRHAWGEAGFRTSSTWSEFADWLRIGR